MTPLEQIQSNILALETALLHAYPTMPSLLRTIHTQLKQNPDCITLLEEKDIGVIVSGLKRQTAIHISTTTSKSNTKATKAKMAAVSVDDLGF